jgi:hypothetical protein
MRGHEGHVWICGVMVAGALLIVAFTGKVAALLPAIGCVLMMVVMMHMMGHGDGHGRDGRS